MNLALYTAGFLTALNLDITVVVHVAWQNSFDLYLVIKVRSKTSISTICLQKYLDFS